MNVNPTSPQKPSADKTLDPPSASRIRATGSAGEGVAASSARASGSLELSPLAKEFLGIRTRLEALPDISREKRIDHLRTLIARGAYQVTGDEIAEAMLRDDAAALTLGLRPDRA